MHGQLTLDEHIRWVINAHQNFPRKPSMAYRKHDGKTPYWVHPIWCATTIAAETKLSERNRQMGAITLLYHDILEDTTAELPKSLGWEMELLIKDMTFQGIDDEINLIGNRPPWIRLYKLYDKVNNLMDGNWMSQEKRKKYTEHTGRLLNDVLRIYGELNITKIAKTIIE